MLGAVKALQTTSLLLCGKEPSKSYTDYHDDMSGILFENWFENTLTANLPKERKVVIVTVQNITIDSLKRQLP